MPHYLIIGSDGKECGPVAAAEIQQWLAAGRINAATQIRPAEAGDWTTLAEIPEFKDLAKPIPPPLPPGAPAKAKTSKLATASLVLGILGLFYGFTALFGLVLGIIALIMIRKSQGRLRGFGRALAGTIVSTAWILFFIMLTMALGAAMQLAMNINCTNNEKQLALAVITYADDHTNQLPHAATWCDDIKTLAGSEKVFQCPAANSEAKGERCDYAFNVKLDGLDRDKVHPDTVMIFDSDGGWNASGGREAVAITRHGSGSLRFVNVAFADGSVRRVPESELATLRWEP